MSMSSHDQTKATESEPLWLVVTLWFVVAVTLVPGLILLGLWLIGMPMDFTTWKTYAAAIVFGAALSFSGKW